MSDNDFVTQLFRMIRINVRSKGKRNEFRAVAAFRGQFRDVPSWFRGIRNATNEQDSKGIDVVVRTDMGEILVQIKSSVLGADRFRLEQGNGRYGKDIAVIVITEGLCHRHVRDAIVSGIFGAYEKMRHANSTMYLSQVTEPLH